MEIIQITKDTLYYIYRFINIPEQISHHFRYFQSRNPEVVLKEHIYTIVGVNEEDEPIAYGHIDFEGKNWLGICVLEPYKGKGYGKQIIEALLSYADKNALELHLTVDEDNLVARKLYEKVGFEYVKGMLMKRKNP